eukprot:404143-Prymnesium_polylepis.2
MSDENVAALQSVVLRAVESAPGCINGHVLSVQRSRQTRTAPAWGSEWPVLKTFARLHPGLSADDVCVADHGTKNTNLVKHILHEGVRAKLQQARRLRVQVA